PALTAICNGTFREQPLWYRQFLYETERERGLEDLEDLATPGTWTWNLAREPAVLIWTTAPQLLPDDALNLPAIELVQRLVVSESTRRSRLSVPQRLSETYLVRTPQRTTIIAGYPWFTDWGRDTFIALRGLCLATGRLEIARSILLEWSGVVSQGMLPNLFPDRGDTPEYNSVDASLWYVVAVHEYLAAREARGEPVPDDDQQRLRAAVQAILTGFSEGTRYRIHADADGLLAAGQPGVQLTWMDAKVGDWVVTPRIGKPVEVQALWLNALAAGARFDPRWNARFEQGLAAFKARFWNEATGGLYDVVDADHVAGRDDGSFRPNQIFAVGGLPLQILDGERAKRVVDAVEARLWTPLGLRSLAPGEAAYAPRYRGGVRERDGAYHQGTVWPWFLGPFVEAWVRVRGDTPKARREARARFLTPLYEHLHAAGLGHISEIADGDAPHTPGGCPFQAWSVGEAIRLDRVVLRERDERGSTARRAPEEVWLAVR
ncbi:MAG: glycogen debranching enzyme N-terminal domain-containing protein, partial [Planctomycetota bacterium]|nr:glycogen debranching enzyme N-terminal domain-containing protein [Planctomycetota bacterium]